MSSGGNNYGYYGQNQGTPYQNYPPPNYGQYQQPYPQNGQPNYYNNYNGNYNNPPYPNYEGNNAQVYPSYPEYGVASSTNQYPPQKPPSAHNNTYGNNPDNPLPTVDEANKLSKQNQGSHIKINTSAEYKDLWATILFLLAFAGYVVCIVVGIPKLRDIPPAPTSGSSSSSLSDKILTIFNSTDIGILIGGSAFIGFILSGLYFFCIYKFAGKVIVISMVINILLMIGTAVLSLLFGNIIVAAVLAVFTLLVAWFYWAARHRIPFAKAMLKAVTAIMKKYPATVFTGFLGMIVTLLVAASLIASVIGMAFHISKNNSQGSSSALYAAIIFMFFAFFWITQVIGNVVHVTISGLFATYYFAGVSAGGEVSVPVKNPTAASAGRALTTSFGPICYGSLIVALIETIKEASRSAANDAASNGNTAGFFCAICMTCLLSCIEDMLEYLNRYAFTQVAIYGKGYCEAAKATWKLVKSHGIDAIINDSLVNSVLNMGSLICSIIGAVYGVVIVFISDRIPNEAITFVIAAFIGLIITSVQFVAVYAAISSGVSTTFVCLAEDPLALQRTKPEMFEKIRQTYPQLNFVSNH